jgi:hypothetical protein
MQPVQPEPSVPRPAASRGAAPPGGNEPTTARRSWKRFAVTWLFVSIGALTFVFLAYRWTGTSTLRATVQRVYEDGGEFRAELVGVDGHVLVAANENMRFPHLKLDAAGRQAELYRFSATSDVVDVSLWGFRLSWLNVFPNIVDVAFVESSKSRRRKLAQEIEQAVRHRLATQGGIRLETRAQTDLVSEIESVLERAEPPTTR